MTTAFVAFLLFGLYLIIIPVGISPFETPKVLLAELVIEILLLINIFRFRKHDYEKLITPQIIFIVILFILSLDTQLLFQPQGAFFGNVFRLQGQFLFWHLLFFSIISKDIKLDKLPTYFYYLSFIGLVLSTLILGVDENRRAFGTLGEPNALAATSLFIFPFVWFHFRRIGLISLITTFLIILLSGSRAGIIGFSIEVLFLVFTYLFKLSTPKSVLICLLVMIFSLLTPMVDQRGWFENRFEIWQTAFIAGMESPFLGQGFGNIQNIIHKTAVSLNNNVQYQVVDSSHNFLLDFWIQAGLVGVISMLILIYLTLQGFIKEHKSIEMVAFLGLITAMMFNPVSVVNLIAFWWLIGQGYLTPYEKMNEVLS